MLIVALVLAVIGLAALVTAVVSSNEVVAWVCIGASALGVILLVVDAVRERQRRATTAVAADETATETTEVDLIADAVPDEAPVEAEVAAEIDDGAPGVGGADEATEVSAEDHPEEVIHDEPEFDTVSDDEPEYPPPAEESAVHTVGEPGSGETGER